MAAPLPDRFESKISVSRCGSLPPKSQLLARRTHRWRRSGASIATGVAGCVVPGPI